MRRAALFPALLLGTVAGAAAVPDGWLSRVQQDIAASEYHVRWLPEALTFEAPNRAQGLRVRFATAGVRLTPREDTSWEWGLTLVAWGRAGALQPVEEASPTASGPM